MRTKEEANDYRYFPEPDLPPVVVTADRIEAIRREMPELPEARRARWVATLGIAPADAAILAADPLRAVRFDDELLSRIDSLPETREGRASREAVAQTIAKLATGASV